jgi:hypothetical protein
VTSTIIADNLRPHHAKTRVGLLSDSARYGIPECGPSAARVELVVCFVERRVASSACVDTGVRVVFVKFAGTRHLGALLSEDAELLCRRVSGCALMSRLELTYLAIAVLATRPQASVPGSSCCPPCC